MLFDVAISDRLAFIIVVLVHFHCFGVELEFVPRCSRMLFLKSCRKSASTGVIEYSLSYLSLLNR